MTTVSSKTYTFTNGTANDAGPVNSEFTTLFTNDATLATAVTNLESNAMTIAGVKTFSSNPKMAGIDEATADQGVTLDGMRGLDGRANVAAIAATISSVDTTTDVITFAAAHGRATGDAVKVRAVPGATLDTGLSASTTYYLRSVSSTTATLHPTAADASGNTNTINITAQGSGTRHLIATPASPNEHDIWSDAGGHKGRYAGANTLLAYLTTITAKSGAYTADASHDGALHTQSGTYTVTLTAAATLGANWRLHIRNIGTGVITIDGNASETIDGRTTILVYPKESFTLVCDGSNFVTIGRSKLVLISTASPSAVASVAFTTGLTDTEIDTHEFVLKNMKPATDNVALYARVSIDGGSTYRSTAGDYAYAGRGLTEGAATNDVASTGNTQIFLTGNASQGNAANETYFGRVRLFNPSNTSEFKTFEITCGYRGTTTNLLNNTIHAQYDGTTDDVDGVQFFYSSGNITSGTIEHWGYRS